MNLCPKCAVEVIPGAKFCHRCGDKIVERTKSCPACHDQNPLSSVFCHHCGFHFDGKQAGIYSARYEIDYTDADLSSQIKALFFSSLRQRVLEEHNIEKYSDYVERFYQSAFREVYEVRSVQIARDAALRYDRFGADALPEIDERISNSFEGLLDYFIIQFCPDLHGFILPTSILRHEQARPGKTDLHEMISDYLDLDRENETVYVDFISMPANYLANACKNFLFAQRKEKVFFIVDLSLKGNCHDGFAMTDQAIYWKMPFDKARSVSYQGIHTVSREKEWLQINGLFFSTNARLNLKMCKLLKKVKGKEWMIKS